MFLGLRNPVPRLLLSALAIYVSAVGFALAGYWIATTALFTTGAVFASAALRIFRVRHSPAEVTGVHPAFPAFIRIAYL